MKYIFYNIGGINMQWNRYVVPYVFAPRCWS